MLDRSPLGRTERRRDINPAKDRKWNRANQEIATNNFASAPTLHNRPHALLVLLDPRDRRTVANPVSEASGKRSRKAIVAAVNLIETLNRLLGPDVVKRFDQRIVIPDSVPQAPAGLAGRSQDPFPFCATLRRLIRLKRDELQPELSDVPAGQVVGVGDTGCTGFGVQAICERIAQRINATARAKLSVQHHDLMSGLDELVSRNEPGQTGAHDNYPPRLLRHRNLPLAEGKPIEWREGEPCRGEQMPQKVASIDQVHRTSAGKM